MSEGFKVCSACKTERPLVDFRKRKSATDGKRSQCKFCEDTFSREKNRTKEGKAKRIAMQQHHSAKRRGHPMPSYSRKELYEWLFSQKEYHTIYDTWKRSGYVKKLAPSVNRINPNKSYTMDNIELITWGENHRLGVEDRSQGVDHVAKKVLQFTLAEEFVEEFVSTVAAGLAMGINAGAIGNACRGTVETSCGFKWCYKEDIK